MPPLLVVSRANHRTSVVPVTATPEGPPADFLPLLDESKGKILACILSKIRPNISDLFALARTCKTAWKVLAGDAALWRDLYLENDPLVTPEVRKRLCSEAYSKLYEPTIVLKRSGLVQAAWLRTACLLYRKPRLVLVLSGRDPVVMRKLGQPEEEAQRIALGINYNLDICLDDDEARFAAEFPQIFQDLDPGDLVVTQDYRGAGCWTSLPGSDPDGHLALKRNKHDVSGFGILSSDIAPPTFPLFYYCDMPPMDLDTLLVMPESMASNNNNNSSSGYTTTTAPTPASFIASYRTGNMPSSASNAEPVIITVNSTPEQRRAVLAREPYWYSYSELKDSTLFSWSDFHVFDEA